MSLHQNILDDIESEKLYGRYKVIDFAENYGKKLGVTMQCIDCEARIRFRYTNLRYSGAKMPVCSCSGTKRSMATVKELEVKCSDGNIVTKEFSIKTGEDFTGVIFSGYTILGYGINETSTVIRCNKCNKVKNVGTMILLKKIHEDVEIGKCSNCKDIDRKNIEHKLSKENHERNREELWNKYTEILAGKTMYGYNILSINRTQPISVTLECVECGKTICIDALKMMYKNGRRVIKCECIASGYAKYSKIVGEVGDANTIIDYKAVKLGNGKSNGYSREYTLKCNKCGRTRQITAANAVYRNFRHSTEIHDIGYRRCDCNKYTTSGNRLHKYEYLKKTKGEGSKLFVTDIMVDENNNIVCEAVCDCGNIKTYNVHSIIRNTTKSCGCMGSSAGEDMVRNILNELGVQFYEQIQGDGLQSERGWALRFDFIVDYSNRVFAIEFNGEQHYDPYTNSFGGRYNNIEDKANRIIDNDNLKREFCAENGIPLLELRYKQYINNPTITREAIKGFIGMV